MLKKTSKKYHSCVTEKYNMTQTNVHIEIIKVQEDVVKCAKLSTLDLAPLQ